MRRFILLIFCVVFLLGPIVLLSLTLEGSPAVEANPTANAIDASRTKNALTRLKTVLDPKIGANRYAITEAEMNSAIAVVARGLPFLRRPRRSRRRRHIHRPIGADTQPGDRALVQSFRLGRAFARATACNGGQARSSGTANGTQLVYLTRRGQSVTRRRPGSDSPWRASTRS